MEIQTSAKTSAPSECLVCQSHRFRAVRNYESPFTHNEYTLYSCDECQSYFFFIEQTPIDLEKVYEQYAQEKIEPFNTQFNPSSYWKHQVDTICRLCKRPIHSVMDVGCRTGDFLMHWPKAIRRVGTELSESWASVARQRGLSVVQGFIENMEFDKQFDVITCYAIVEHLREPIPFLVRLSNLIHKDGIVVVMTLTHECFKQKVLFAVGRQWHMYSPPQHLNFLSRKKLDETMEKHGFTLVARKYTSGGMFHPFRKVPLVRYAFSKVMALWDVYSPLSFLPIFDHMYSYYVRG